MIGYGNELRADDGVGRVVAERLDRDPRFRSVNVRSVRQLTPELAADIAAASTVVLVDASSELAAGEVRTGFPGRDGGGRPYSHHLVPATLVELAATLFGVQPRCVVVSVGVGSTAFGEGLSVEADAAAARAVELVARLVGVDGAVGSPGEA